MNSELSFDMLVNQLTCKCGPVFKVRLIIDLLCVKSPAVLTLKPEKRQNVESFCSCSTNFIIVHI